MRENQQLERKAPWNPTLKGAALDRFLVAEQGRHWDATFLPGVGLEDLSSETLAHFRKLAKRRGRVADDLLSASDAALVDRLRLLDGDSLKRAAVLLFGKDPERLVEGAFLEIGAFSADGEPLYHDEVHGDLFTQIDTGYGLLRTKYLEAGVSYLGSACIEVLPVPARALHEALVNAIVHKDYAAAVPVRVSVYPDRLLIWNPGHLPKGWTLAHLSAKHAFYPSNPDIAKVFFRAAYMEAFGRGIDFIRGACAEHECPEPQLRWDDGLCIELGFADFEVEATPRLERLLTVLRGDMLGEAIRVRLGLQDRDLFRGRYLAPALAAGLIAMADPDEPDSRLQRFRLTARGEAHLAARNDRSGHRPRFSG